MARKKVEITPETLAELGTERLVELLVEHAATDRQLEKKLRLALAAGQGEDVLIKALTQRLKDLRRGTRFVEWRESRGFAHELDQIRASITADLLPRAPRAATTLLEDLVHSSDRVMERVDDSDGVIAGVFREALADWGRAWCRVPERRPAILAGTVLYELTHNDYGLKDGIVRAFAEALGEDGLVELGRLIQTELDSRPAPRMHGRWDGERYTLISGLAAVADARGDVDAFIEAMGLGGHPERHAAEIAERLLGASRPDAALDWLERADDAHQHDRHRTVDLRIAALEALGRHAAAQAARWDWFGATLSVRHFSNFAAGLADPERSRATDRALATAERHDRVGSALHFLAEIGELAAAERLVLARAGEIDGRDYQVLRPVAARLAEAQPLGAVVLYRAMAEAVLAESRSKSYPYAARDLSRAAQTAEFVVDWRDVEPHAAFLERLHQEHRRKLAFWSLVEGKQAVTG